MSMIERKGADATAEVTSFGAGAGAGAGAASTVSSVASDVILLKGWTESSQDALRASLKDKKVTLWVKKTGVSSLSSSGRAVPDKDNMHVRIWNSESNPDAYGLLIDGGLKRTTKVTTDAAELEKAIIGYAERECQRTIVGFYKA